MKAIRPRCLPPTYQDAPDEGRLILRDGSTASMRLSRPSDLPAVRDFFGRLSPESRRMRFFTETKPGEDVLDRFCDSSDPARQATLLVFRFSEGATRIIASGSYLAHQAVKAEFAVAVDDGFHGLGLGGLLLERLAVLAASQGFSQFVAVTHPTNRPMLDVFRHSGFALNEHFEDGCIEVDLSVEPREQSAAHAEWRDRVFTRASLRPFFRPRSVAVIGASRDPASFGHRIMESLVRNGFNGPVYPVNPNAQVICSIKAYPAASAIPEPVDLAILAIPRDRMLDVIDDCAKRGIRALIIIAAGFAEAGPAGRALQQAVVDKVRGYGMRLVGPNCLGLINTDPSIRLNASFATGFPAPGRIALSSQSGALGLAILGLARQRDLGLSMFVSVGNKADVTGNDLLYYWEDDPSVDVILLYLESFGNPRRFARIARQVARRKPIVCVKAGNSRSGESAVEALFQQTGVIRADTLEDLFDAGALLGNQPIPKGRRVSILTNSFGCGILCRDTCEAGGLALPGPSTGFAQAHANVLPDLATIGGIIDLTSEATASLYGRMAESLLSDPEVDALVVCYVPLGAADTPAVLQSVGEGVSRARTGGGAGKPVLAVVMAGDANRGLIRAGGESLPCYLFPETAARALIAAMDYADWRRAPAGVFVDFEDIDIPTVRQMAQAACAAGAERTLTPEELRVVSTSFRLTPPAEMCDGAIEVREDPTFGPILRLSREDRTASVSHPQDRIMPLTDRDASELVRASFGDTPRGSAAAAEELLLRISLLIEEVHEIRSLTLRWRQGSEPSSGSMDLCIAVGRPKKVSPVAHEREGA